MNVFKRKRRKPDGTVVAAKTYSARHRFAGDTAPTTIQLNVTRKDVAEKLGGAGVAREERKRAGLIVDPAELQTSSEPLIELVEEFRASLINRNLEADYVRKPVQRCRDLFEQLRWKRVADANALELRRFLEASSMKPRTRNHYIDAVTQFFRWLHRDGRIPSNPVASVPHFKVKYTDSYERAAFSEDELRLLIDPQTTDLRRLYRADVYALMVFSGLRWAEAKRLQVRDIRRDEDGYSIMIPRGKDKANRGDVIELPDELAPVIDRLTGNRPGEEQLLSRGMPARQTLRKDCEAAGIERERADGSRLVRYSSRDTYTSLLRVLARSTDQLRALTRHTPRGMEDRYTDRKTQGRRKLVNDLQVVVPSRGESEPTPSVHSSVHTLATVAQTAILRGFDSPRLHSQSNGPTPGFPGCRSLRRRSAGTAEPSEDEVKIRKIGHTVAVDVAGDPSAERPEDNVQVTEVDRAVPVEIRRATHGAPEPTDHLEPTAAHGRARIGLPERAIHHERTAGGLPPTAVEGPLADLERSTRHDDPAEARDRHERGQPPPGCVSALHVGHSFRAHRPAPILRASEASRDASIPSAALRPKDSGCSSLPTASPVFHSSTGIRFAFAKASSRTPVTCQETFAPGTPPAITKTPCSVISWAMYRLGIGAPTAVSWYRKSRFSAWK